MDRQSQDTQQDRSATAERQITVEVPEDRVPEFYASYAHFLAGSRRRGRPGRGPRGRHGHGPHGRCGEHRDEAPATEAPAA